MLLPKTHGVSPDRSPGVACASTLADQIAAVEHRQDVVDLIGEVRRDGLGLLQDRQFRAQPWIAHQRADVERRRDDHAADVAPFDRRRGLRIRRRVPDGLPAALTGTSHTQVDAAGMECGERAEALDHGDGRRLTELHRGGTDANPVGGGGDLADQDGGLRAGDRDEMMLGEPVASVTPLLGVLGEVDGVAQCRCGVTAFADRGQVEDRQRNGHVCPSFA